MLISSHAHFLPGSFPPRLISSQAHFLPGSFPLRLISSQAHVLPGSFPLLCGRGNEPGNKASSIPPQVGVIESTQTLSATNPVQLHCSEINSTICHPHCISLPTHRRTSGATYLTNTRNWSSANRTPFQYFLQYSNSHWACFYALLIYKSLTKISPLPLVYKRVIFCYIHVGIACGENSTMFLYFHSQSLL